MMSPDKLFVQCPSCSKQSVHEEHVNMVMGEYIMKGYKPTGTSCDKCSLPTLQYQNQSIYQTCVLCGDLGHSPNDTYEFKVGERVMQGDKVVSQKCSFCHVSLLHNARSGNLDCVMCGNSTLMESSFEQTMTNPYDQSIMATQISNTSDSQCVQTYDEHETDNPVIMFPADHELFCPSSPIPNDSIPGHEPVSPLGEVRDIEAISEIPEELITKMNELRTRLTNEDTSLEEQGEISLQLQELAAQMVAM